MARPDLPPYLTTGQAAAALDVSISTVKRWVDDGLLPAHVTPGGHRKLLRAEVHAFARQHLPFAEPAEGPTAAGLGVRAAVLAEALMTGAGAEARALVRRTYSDGTPMETLADRVVAPAMAAVGHRWATGRLDVWEEHRGTQLCSAALHDLKALLEPRAGRGRPVAVGGAPAGDPYTLPSQLAQLVLLDAGWQAVNLGPNTPLASLAGAVRELRPRLVWVSASFLPDEAAFVADCRALYRAAERTGVAVAVGGRALAHGVRARITYTTFGDGLTHLAAFARTLHPPPRRPRRGRPGRRG